MPNENPEFKIWNFPVVRTLKRSSAASRWRCSACNYIKHFTQPVAAVIAEGCPKCDAVRLEPLPD